jgi:hypothetical protein
MNVYYTKHLIRQEKDRLNLNQCSGAGAGGAAPFCWSRSQSFFFARLQRRVCNKCYKNPKFSTLKLAVDFKNHNFVSIYLKGPFNDHLCLQNMKFC